MGDFYGVLNPLQIFGKCIGLSVWTLQGEVGSSDRGYVIQKRDKLWNVITAILCLSMCAGLFISCPKSLNEVQLVSLLLIQYCGYFTMCELLFISNIFRKRTMCMIKDIAEVDGRILSLTKRKCNYSKPRNHVIYYMVLCLSLVLIEALLGLIVALNQGWIFDRDFRCSIASVIPFGLNLYVDIFLLIILKALSTRFLKINQHCEYLVNQSYSNVSFAKQLMEIKNIYNILWDVGKEINTIFEVILLFKIIMCSLNVLTHLFMVTLGDFKGEPITILTYCSLGFWISLNFLDVCVIVYHFVGYTKQAKKTVQLMENVQKSVGKSNLAYKQVELFSLQVYVENFKFTVFGFFPLDWTLLHSMISGIATYLVIFHQFSNMERTT